MKVFLRQTERRLEGREKFCFACFWKMWTYRLWHWNFDNFSKLFFSTKIGQFFRKIPKAETEVYTTSVLRIAYLRAFKKALQIQLFLKKMGHSRPLFLYFRLFNTQLTVYKCSILINFCRWLNSNRGPLVSEATALPTERQPLPLQIQLLRMTHTCCIWHVQLNQLSHASITAYAFPILSPECWLRKLLHQGKGLFWLFEFYASAYGGALWKNRNFPISVEMLNGLLCNL